MSAPGSASVKVFVTGVSGYIGGTVLDTLARQHPDFRYTVLVRSQSSAQKIEEAYPWVDVIEGCLDDLDLIQNEAADSDVVVNIANNDHTSSIPAILKGLSTPFPTNDVLGREPSKNRYLIHTSGTSILLDKAFGRGIETAHLYSDEPDSHDELIYELPDDAWHRDVDKLVLFDGLCPRAQNVHVAIICPPCVYGRGTGTGKIVSWQLPQMIKHFIERGKGFTIDKGDAVWGNVHVEDLASIYLLLLELAVLNNDDNEMYWDVTGGYYLSASGEHHWGDIMKLVAQTLYEHGKIKTAELDQLSPDEVIALGSKTGPLEWGCNSRGRAMRAQQLLGWKPLRGSLHLFAEDWDVNVPVGLGWGEVENEVEMFEEGLCK